MLYKKKTVTINTFLIAFGFGLVFTGLMILYQWEFDMDAFADALFVAGFLLFAFGWFFFISNENLFSLVVYGVQSFWLNMIGRRKDKSYIEYITDKPKISSHVYKSLWMASIPFLFTGILLLFI
jgi:hypothetical protein